MDRRAARNSARCNASGMALSAVARRNQSALATDASPPVNSDDEASNWPDALTANVAPTGGRAPCSLNSRLVSATLSPWKSVARNASVASAKCSSGTSIEAAVALADMVRLVSASRATCAVCRKTVRPQALISNRATITRATGREIRRSGATRKLATRFTATSVREVGKVVAESYDMVSSGLARPLHALRYSIFPRAQSNQVCPCVSDGLIARDTMGWGDVPTPASRR